MERTSRIYKMSSPNTSVVPPSIPSKEAGQSLQGKAAGRDGDPASLQSMGPRLRNSGTTALICLIACSFMSSRPAYAEDKDEAMMKAATMDAGRMNGAETGLYEQSIKTTKQNIA